VAVLADAVFDFHVSGSREVLLLLLLPAMSLYFIPSIIAAVRHCRTTVWVFAINVLAGWTVVGWVVALGVAAGSQRGDRPPPEARWRGTWQ
jgi:hypothetical protein